MCLIFKSTHVVHGTETSNPVGRGAAERQDRGYRGYRGLDSTMLPFFKISNWISNPSENEYKRPTESKFHIL